MLLISGLLGSLSCTIPSLMPALLLFLAAALLFVGRHAVGQRLRGKQSASAIPLIPGSIGGAVFIFFILLMGYHCVDLVYPAFIGSILIAVHFLLSRVSSRRRIDRSIWGELLGAVTLSLTAPAARIAAGGPLDEKAWALWGLCAVYFGSGVIFVKMLVETRRLSRRSGRVDSPGAFGIERLHQWFHGLLLGGLAAQFIFPRDTDYHYLLVAFGPALLRSLILKRRWMGRTVSFHRIGIVEAAGAVWFFIFALAYLR